MYNICRFVLASLYFVVWVQGDWPFKSAITTLCKSKVAKDIPVISTEIAKTSVECGVTCARHHSCKSANFRRNDRMCELLAIGYTFLGGKCDCLDEDVDSEFIYMDYPCFFKQPSIGGVCMCGDGYTGEFCENPPRDCDVYAGNGDRQIYIYPDTCNEVSVKCVATRTSVFVSNDIGWSILRNSNWATYKNMGFGNQGNDLMHRITNTKFNYSLRFSFEDTNSIWYKGLYHNFRLDDESSNYTMHFSHYETTKGLPDQVLFDGTQFRTFDYNDNGCVEIYGSAFWYDDNCTFPSVFLEYAPVSGVMKKIKKVRMLLSRNM